MWKTLFVTLFCVANAEECTDGPYSCSANLRLCGGYFGKEFCPRTCGYCQDTTTTTTAATTTKATPVADFGRKDTEPMCEEIDVEEDCEDIFARDECPILCQKATTTTTAASTTKATPVAAICTPKCVNGNCEKPNTCSCSHGWNGPRCQNPICNPECVNGKCTGPNTCTCEQGWEGLQCQNPVCRPECANGKCRGPNTCSCKSGWEGPQCQNPVCRPECANGICRGPNTCSCKSGWEGPQCQNLPTTTTTTTTTTTVPTTTTAPMTKGSCDSKSVIIEDGLEFYWTSPGYDGVTHYPASDYNCTLTITMPSKYLMFMVTTVFESPSIIHETPACKGDSILYKSSSGVKTTLCGDQSKHSLAETQIFNGPLTFSFTWKSVANDVHFGRGSTHPDGTNIGFNMTISGMDLMGK